MTDEEYLKAKGWKQAVDTWCRHPGAACEWIPINEAVALQVEEDRQCLAFVLARTDLTLHTTAPSDDPVSPFRQKVTIDVDRVDVEPKQ